MDHQEAEELGADVNRVLRSTHTPKPHLTKGGIKALAELRKDSNKTILTADKGVAMVVMDRKDYIDKANNLLAQLAYRTINRDQLISSKLSLLPNSGEYKGNQV